MKVLSIFNKNLKSVARSWPYFAVLFLMPVVLIVIAGSVLNSVDFDNVRVGSVGDSSGLNMGGVPNVDYYDSLADCLLDLINSKMTVCVSSSSGDDGEFLDIYLDNSNKVVSFYAKQFIMANLLDLQTGIFKETSDQISSKVALYSTSIVRARVDLIEARGELEDQEELLKEYKANLTELRSDFNEVYYPIKEMEPEINEMQAELHGAQEDVSYARSRVDNIEQNLMVLSNFLSMQLIVGDMTYASGLIEDINSDLAEIDAALSKAGEVDPRIVEVVNNLDLIIKQLDEIKLLLDRLDDDLDRSIVQTRESRDQIDSFIADLDEVYGELSVVDQDISSNQISFSFNDAFDVPDDPVLMAFPLLIALIIAFTSLVLSNMFILKEINQRSYQREIISPTWDSNFLFADYLINLFFVAIQTVVLFLFGNFLFGLPFSGLPVFALAIFLTASIFIFIGMSIGYLVKHQSLSMLLTIFLLMILIVFSDILAPSILTGKIVLFFIGLNPFMILKNLLENLLIYNRGFESIIQSFIRLGVFFVMMLCIVYFSNKFSKESI